MVFLPLAMGVLLLSVVRSEEVETVGVKGRLVCGDQPIVGAEIKISDRNDMSAFTAKDTEGKTDEEGYFKIIRTAPRNRFGARFELSILHRCNIEEAAKEKNMKEVPASCKRNNYLKIDPSHISKSGEVEKWFDWETKNMKYRATEDEYLRCW